MAKVSPARHAALRALMEAHQTDRYVREILAAQESPSDLDARDAAFALRLALGVTATEGCLDEALNQFLAKPNKLSSRVRMALRISAFEALYLETASEVVVSQGVELVRTCAKSAAGLANAVLRRVCENRDGFLAAVDVADDQQALVSASRRAGLPVWLVRAIEASLGEQTASSMFAAQLDAAPLSVLVNPLHADAAHAALQTSRANQRNLPGSYDVEAMGKLVASGAFERADLIASDYHAQLIAAAATQPGSCLEIGAGRGTKTFMMHAHAHVAQLERIHVAVDLSEGKCRANTERIERADFGTLQTAFGDARDLDAVLAEVDALHGSSVQLDIVFVDAPCSGTGTMRRHPEIPWRLSLEDVRTNLPELQLALLQAAAKRVASGGELIYATCSVLSAENQDVVDAFLATDAGSDFHLVPVSGADIFAYSAYKQTRAEVEAHQDERGLFQTTPVSGGFDGHFCARLVRNNRQTRCV